MPDNNVKRDCIGKFPLFSKSNINADIALRVILVCIVSSAIHTYAIDLSHYYVYATRRTMHCSSCSHSQISQYWWCSEFVCIMT